MTFSHIHSFYFFFLFSYTGTVVGNGLQAQRQNPEIKVKGVDPVLIEAKETLERFNQVKAHFVHIALLDEQKIMQLPPVSWPKTMPHVY